MKPNGVIVHEDSRVVVIATGLRRSSENSKTGKMIQIWILNRNVNPIEALMTGQDDVVCFDCPLRGKLGQRACYVNLPKAPLAIYRAYQRGNYPKISNVAYSDAFCGKSDRWLELFRNRVVRFGAYGEPVLIPFQILKAIANVATSWTGYTHQWRNPAFQSYRSYLMASCDRRDWQDAQALGWRTFTVSSERIADQIVCPASAERGHATTCDNCTLCAGTSARSTRSIQIQPHGASRNAIAQASL